MKFDVQHIDNNLKVKFEVVRTYPKYSTKFVDKPFRFPRKPKIFKPLVMNNNE